MSYADLKNLSPLEKSRKMENLNLIRFETHAILRGVKREDITAEMRNRVRECCVGAYEADSETFLIDPGTLLEAGLGTMPEVELNI